ncbi:Crp/Fnr family transcriptional regulator [Chryseolinea sp. H1M3-3]|uniref:Crp/Fnr family transcriptional regulator n=1 Tax=Chryseolinea sp. H1M3-3 TaxID=3034144 RepID=UPI0023EC5414|nr:Crp/Fnr family transcriptional regulator [Chryseolinea sp. H1M3-3]
MGEELRDFFEKQVPLEDEAWEDLQKIISLKDLKKKQHFLRQGEICRQLGFIVCGYVRLYYLKDGEEITKDFNFENSFCGSYASFSLGQPSRFNVIAMEKVKLYAIGRDELFRLFDKYSSLQKLGRLSMEHMFIRKEMRESSFLLDSAEQRYKDLLSQYPQIQQRVPLKYLASYLGMTAETLSRIRGNKT